MKKVVQIDAVLVGLRLIEYMLFDDGTVWKKDSAALNDGWKQVEGPADE